MKTASDMYIAFLERLRHQKTTTATPDEFNAIAKKTLLSWLEQVRVMYDQHEKVLEGANSLVDTNTISALNGVFPVPYEVQGNEVNAYLLNVHFIGQGCHQDLQGVRLLEHHNNNRYYKHSNWEVHYKLEQNNIMPYHTNHTLDTCDVTVLKFPNMIALNPDGTSLVNSNLPSHVNNTLVNIMVQNYLELTQSSRIQTFQTN